MNINSEDAKQAQNRIIQTAGFSVPFVATSQIVTRKATLADATAIADLVNLGEHEGQLLPRSLEFIRASVGDWIVAEDRENIVGAGSLLEMSAVLSEVRSLVVAPAYRQNGVGAKIVAALVEEARARGIATVFALTRAVPFFEKLEFSVTEKGNFPEKVWRDCAICPVRHACDEVAVVKAVVRRP